MQVVKVITKIAKTTCYCLLMCYVIYSVSLVTEGTLQFLTESTELSRDIHGNLTRIESLLEKVIPREDSILRRLL